MIGRRQFLAGAATAVALPAYLRQAWAQSPEVELKLHHFLGPKAPAQTKMFEPWAQRIADDDSLAWVAPGDLASLGIPAPIRTLLNRLFED